MNVYELPIRTEIDLSSQSTRNRVYTYLPLPLIIKYVLWFCNFRWVFIATLVIFSMFGYFPFIFRYFGLHSNTLWALVTAVVLSVLNIGYIKHINLMKKTEKYDNILKNIWLQIALDLIVLTGVVHYIGVIETYLPFAYIFHIVLACIFFPIYQSLLVTIIVCLLYIACISAEVFEIISSAGIYADRIIYNNFEYTPFALTFNVLSAIAIWFIVWYLASHLSGMVREREYELIKTNQKLKNAQEVKTKHLLRITHELKAPFAAIDANIQLLLRGHCGLFPETASEILQRISERSRKVGHEIQEMLQLANLSTENIDTLEWKQIDLVGTIEWCMIQVSPTAEKKKIIFEKDFEPAFVIAVEEHMKMLFTNLLSNAIIYSHERGRVSIICKLSNETGCPIVEIEDHGIGIHKDKIPKIFDEYYKTDEAVRHNKSSTGLGLAIVHNVVQAHKIIVIVTSILGEGTKFELRFPSS